MLQHRLFHRAPEPIEGAVQTRTRAGARDVPGTRLPLDRLPQASGEPHVVPEVARARRDERRQRHLRDYVRLSGRLREAIKWQSRGWDVASAGARARLYRSLYGFRGAVEEAM